MVSQNTVSRTELTERDKEVIGVCGEISRILEDSIVSSKREIFRTEYGRIHYSRDAGQGRGAGKLQRDALCTRGRQAKAPFSNRNLRWHPLVLSNICPQGFTEMDLTIDNQSKLLKFTPRDHRSKIFLPKDVYALTKPYCVTRDAWTPYLDDLRKWTTDDWIQNWCTIPIIEYCPWEYAVESFSILGIAVAVGTFGADLNTTYEKIRNLLKGKFKLSEHYPPMTAEIIQCPLCKSYINEYPAGLNKRERPEIWKPGWQKTKRREGEDESIQLMHVHPLVESQIYHNASNVRYGHRWCNVAMTDHSISQTTEWMKEIVERHTNK